MSNYTASACWELRLPEPAVQRNPRIHQGRKAGCWDNHQTHSYNPLPMTPS
eukprot:CAMPEP_0172643034 /NCGR_PEP_ID=MMETSP1068-20121228/234920_1 /TAXON_ID=35684 /ORGANISM="Pseudopedinella elastica, Strain CCMP716" /LENGTH=50 /DNA_ID=CAMNT_0013456977 /DNA_START=37 /DNA_END=185 /DNA_ORIENTATION=-